MIKTMIVEDEKLARDELKFLIEEDPDFKVLSEIANGKKALEILKENKWDHTEAYCSNKSICEDFDHTHLTFNKNLGACFFLSDCEFLISNTGAILMSSCQLGDKKLSDLPLNFIIIAKTSQLIKTIGEGLQNINKRYDRNLPTNITTIKTFDENKDSDFMNYGSTPKNLYLLLLEDL